MRKIVSVLVIVSMVLLVTSCGVTPHNNESVSTENVTNTFLALGDNYAMYVDGHGVFKNCENRGNETLYNQCRYFTYDIDVVHGDATNIRELSDVQILDAVYYDTIDVTVFSFIPATATADFTDTVLCAVPQTEEVTYSYMPVSSHEQVGLVVKKSVKYTIDISELSNEYIGTVEAYRESDNCWKSIVGKLSGKEYYIVIESFPYPDSIKHTFYIDDVEDILLELGYRQDAKTPTTWSKTEETTKIYSSIWYIA